MHGREGEGGKENKGLEDGVLIGHACASYGACGGDDACASCATWLASHPIYTMRRKRRREGRREGKRKGEFIHPIPFDRGGRRADGREGWREGKKR